jgi:hypothetical protein
MIYDLDQFCVKSGERVGVAGSHHGIEAGRVCGQGVRVHAAADGARRHFGGSLLRGSDGKLVEAGARLGLAIRVEEFPVGHEAVSSKEPEQDELALEGAAAGADGAEVRPPYEERIGTQVENVL